MFEITVAFSAQDRIIIYNSRPRSALGWGWILDKVYYYRFISTDVLMWLPQSQRINQGLVHHMNPQNVTSKHDKIRIW